MDIKAQTFTTPYFLNMLYINEWIFHITATADRKITLYVELCGPIKHDEQLTNAAKTEYKHNAWFQLKTFSSQSYCNNDDILWTKCTIKLLHNKLQSAKKIKWIGWLCRAGNVGAESLLIACHQPQELYDVKERIRPKPGFHQSCHWIVALKTHFSSQLWCYYHSWMQWAVFVFDWPH